MPEHTFADDIEKLRIDLEFDLKNSGGVFRFRYLKEFSEWVQQEIEFWRWLQESNGSFTRQALGSSYFDQFFAPINQVQQQISTLRNQHAVLLSQYGAARSDSNLVSRDEKIVNAIARLDEAVIGFKSQVGNTLVNFIVQRKSHMYRGVPEAIFVSEMAKEDPSTAVYILAQFLDDVRGAESMSGFETKGRALALLYSKGWLPKSNFYHSRIYEPTLKGIDRRGAQQRRIYKRSLIPNFKRMKATLKHFGLLMKISCNYMAR